MKRMSPAAARAINNELWDPPPGMVKIRCAGCRFWFAAPSVSTGTCPDCAEVSAPSRRRGSGRATAPAPAAAAARLP